MQLRGDVGVAELEGEPVVRQGQKSLEPRHRGGRGGRAEHPYGRGDRGIDGQGGRGAVHRVELRGQTAVDRGQLGQLVRGEKTARQGGRRDRTTRAIGVCAPASAGTTTTLDAVSPPLVARTG